MNVIDFHTHIFPDSLAERALAALTDNNHGVQPHTNGTLAGLRASMKKNGIARSVLLPIATKPSQVPIINAACATQFDDDIVPFGTLHPYTVDIQNEVARLVSLGVLGIKLHPEYQNFYIDDSRHFPLYDALTNAGLIVLFHAGKDPGPFTCDHALPPAIKKVHQNFPAMKMIAAHMGGWLVWNEVSELLAGLPIYLDTAAVRDFLPAPELVKLIKKHGADHVLFGSDSPWYDQGDDIRYIESLDLTQNEKDCILFANAKNLLGIK
jgi:predicted TIM-barrel fold metal-dependent hydrolase